jgi:hypothetical protein
MHPGAAGSFEDPPRIEIIPARSYPVSGGKNKCPQCGRAMKDLQAHMLTHLDERPEKCPIETCEFHTKGFARKYDKNRHTLIHYKGTMICPFCPGVGTDFEKGFNRADVFKKHLMKSHGVEQTPPNSRKNLLASGGGMAGHNGSGVNASCSICRSQFATAQAFYEHLDECIFSQVLSTVPQDTAGAGADNHGGTRSSSLSGASGGLKNSTFTAEARTTTPARVGRGLDLEHQKHDGNGDDRGPMGESHQLTEDSTPSRPSTREDGRATHQHDTIDVSATITDRPIPGTAAPIPVDVHRESDVQRTPERIPVGVPPNHHTQPTVKRESQLGIDKPPQLKIDLQSPPARKPLPSAPGQREEDIHPPAPSALGSRDPVEGRRGDDPAEPPIQHQPSSSDSPAPPEDKMDVDT